ncbi:MAG TPA: DUF2911 domain-containing protein [Gemmatimonadaceae bacterium]
MSVRSSLITLSLAAAVLPAAAQNNQAPPIRIAASSFATVEVHVNQRPIGRRWYEEDAGLTGPARIAISYGQPHARGRKIVGGLIPNDTVWRFGANTATTLHTDVDLTLGSASIPRGDYTLFLQHTGSAWSLIVNSQTGQWGTDRNAAKDLAKVALTAKEMKDNEETLTIYLVPSSADPSTGYAALSGVMRIRWGTVELSVPWTVRQ